MFFVLSQVLIGEQSLLPLCKEAVINDGARGGKCCGRSNVITRSQVSAHKELCGYFFESANICIHKGNILLKYDNIMDA